ncbi:MAG: hypothetical protein WDN75_10665 [Bacteroidota bacterium]
MPTPLITALDNGISPLSVRVSFMNDAVHVVDQQDIDISIIAATAAGGSLFFNDVPPYVGGVNGGSLITVGNVVNVVATKLDFTGQPASYAGFNEPFNGGTLTARDQFSLKDINFNSPLAIASGVTTTGSFSFVNGVASLAGMLYNGTGSGNAYYYRSRSFKQSTGFV